MKSNIMSELAMQDLIDIIKEVHLCATDQIHFLKDKKIPKDLVEKIYHLKHRLLSWNKEPDTDYSKAVFNMCTAAIDEAMKKDFGYTHNYNIITLGDSIVFEHDLNTIHLICKIIRTPNGDDIFITNKGESFQSPLPNEICKEIKCYDRFRIIEHQDISPYYSNINIIDPKE